MGVFVTQSSWARGEADERAQDRADADLIRTAALRMENFEPRLVGGVQKRPPLTLPLAQIFPEDRAEFEPRDFAALSFQYSGLVVLITLWYMYSLGAGTHHITIRASLHRVDDPSVSVGSSDETTFQVDPADFNDGIPFGQGADPLHWYVNLSSLGPTGFLTSPYFSLRRVYISYSGGSYSAVIESPQFYEELYGQSFIYNESKLAVVDGAAVEVLSTGETIIFNGAEGVIDTIYDYDDTNVADQWLYDDYPSARIVSMEGTPYSGLIYGRNAALGRAHRPLSDPFGGNPRLSTFHQGRFMVFSTEENPTRMWASKPQNPFVIRGSAENVDSPIEYDLAADRAEGFTWVSAQDQVLLGSPVAEYIIDSLSDQPLGPGSFGFYKVSEQGASAVRPARSDSSLFLSPRGRQAVAVFQYSDEVQGFRAQYITGTAPHLFQGGVERLEFVAPQGDSGAPKIYAIVNTENGRRLRVCTYDEDAGVLGWSRYDIPAQQELRDLVRVGPRTYIVMQSQDTGHVYLSHVSDEDEYFMDMKAIGTVQETAEYKVIWIDHGVNGRIFENERATILESDGNWFGEGIVEFGDMGGSLPTDWAYIDISDDELLDDEQEVLVGVAYTARLDAFPPTPDAAAVNRPTRTIRALVSVHKTADLWVNGGSALLGPPKAGKPVQEAVSGTREVRILGWNPRPMLRLESTWPYACTILSVTREVQVG